MKILKSLTTRAFNLVHRCVHGTAMALAGDGGMGLGPNRGFVPARGLGPDYLPDKEPIWRRCQVAGSHPPAKPPIPNPPVLPPCLNVGDWNAKFKNSDVY